MERFGNSKKKIAKIMKIQHVINTQQRQHYRLLLLQQIL